MAISVPAMLFADRWGRRTSAMTGGILLTGCMWLMGILYAAQSVHPYGVARWVVVTLIFIFALSYTSTWAVMGKIYASEIQPTKTRAAANCFAQGLGFFTNWLVAFITPILLAKSAYGAYFLFGTLAFFTLAVFFAYMPETQGRPLESIQESFQNLPSVGERLSSILSRKVAGGRVGAALGAPPDSLQPGTRLEEVELTDVGGLLSVRPAIV